MFRNEHANYYACALLGGRTGSTFHNLTRDRGHMTLLELVNFVTSYYVSFVFVYTSVHVCVHMTLVIVVYIQQHIRLCICIYIYIFVYTNIKRYIE